MTELKATPGKWQAKVVNGRMTVRTGDELNDICICTLDSMLTKSATRDAHLMAAAPEMEEALKICLRYIEFDERANGGKGAEGEKARAALKKARGDNG